MYKQILRKINKIDLQVRYLKTHVSDSELIVRTIRKNLESFSKMTFFHIGTQDGSLAVKLIDSGVIIFFSNFQC